MPRGNDILAAAEARLLAERARQPLTQTCAFCGAGWTGTAGDVIAAARTHRLEHHPDVKITKRVQRRLGAPRSVTSRSLGDNIAAARAQGASTWLSDDLTPGGITL